MRWRGEPLWELGAEYTRNRFCWWPTKTNTGEWVWLERVTEMFVARYRWSSIQEGPEWCRILRVPTARWPYARLKE